MLQSIAAYGTQVTQTQQRTDMNIAVLKKAKDQMETTGKAAIALIESVGRVQQAPPTGDHTGKRINVRA